MTAKIALCTDVLTCRNPGMIGLEGEDLESQAWLDVHVSGEEARRCVAKAAELREAWVATCDDVEAINLAAVLKRDRPDLVVRLVDFDAGGSLMSRASSASIDEVMGRRVFVERYAKEKGRSQGECFAGESACGQGSAAGGGKLSEVLGLGKLQPAQEGSGKHVAAQRGPGMLQLTRVASGEGMAVPAASDPDGSANVRDPRGAVARIRAFVMPVVSGSGGAGKSTMAVLGAFIAHALGFKTLLLDYDLQFGDASVLAGIENPPTIDEVLERPASLERELKREGGPSLIAAPARLEAAEQVAHAVPELLSRLESSFDVIIANTGASWAEQHAALLERSTAVLFLVDQRSSSVRACRHALELCARCGIATGQFQFALNRCSKAAPLSTVDVSCALHGADVAELRDGGRDVEDYLAAGAALELIESGNELCSSLQRVMAELLPAAGANLTEAQAVSRNQKASRRRGRHVGKRKGWGR